MTTEIVIILLCLSVFSALVQRAKLPSTKKPIQNINEPSVRQAGLRYDITKIYDDRLNYDIKSNLPVSILIVVRFYGSVKLFFLNLHNFSW